MKPMEWHSTNEFTLEGVKFLCSLDDSTRKTDQDRIIILKDRGSLEGYCEVLRHRQVRNVLEFGILEGGSAALFSLLLPLDKFVGLDIRDSAKGIEPFLANHPAGRRIKFHFGVSQSDEPRVLEIIRSEFKGTPIDMIIDDASHEYALTKKTFELAFPHLRPGGLYVIEDWGWPHWKGCHLFQGQPAMSMLIFELAMICATNPDIIRDIVLYPSFAFITRAATGVELRDFSIERSYQKRGLALSFEDQPASNGRLAGIWRKVKNSVVSPGSAQRPV